jgi:hypothetical protein
MTTQRPTVTTYNLQTAAGRHIRKATKVTFKDGQVVRFTELLPARLAVPQATNLLRSGKV